MVRAAASRSCVLLLLLLLLGLGAAAGARGPAKAGAGTGRERGVDEKRRGDEPFPAPEAPKVAERMIIIFMKTISCIKLDEMHVIIVIPQGPVLP